MAVGGGVDAALLTAAVAGAVALLVQTIGLLLLRRSPMAPERDAYIGDLKGRNALLERENQDHELALESLRREFEKHKADSNTRIAKLERENAQLREEVRRLERENLDFYRRFPEVERRSHDRESRDDV